MLVCDLGLGIASGPAKMVLFALLNGMKSCYDVMTIRPFEQALVLSSRRHENRLDVKNNGRSFVARLHQQRSEPNHLHDLQRRVQTSFQPTPLPTPPLGGTLSHGSSSSSRHTCRFLRTATRRRKLVCQKIRQRNACAGTYRQ